MATIRARLPSPAGLAFSTLPRVHSAARRGPGAAKQRRAAMADTI
jgi:hypothetical protein